MSMRLFVVVAALLVALLLNAALIFSEKVPEPIRSAKEYKVEDRFKTMRYTAGTRSDNLTAFGLPKPVVEKVEERIKAMAKRDRKNLMIQVMKDNTDTAGLLCSNTGSVPSRYQAVGILLNGEAGARRKVTSFNMLLKRMPLAEEYRPGDLADMYQATEMVPNAEVDAFVLNIGALLQGQEIERLAKEDDWGDGIFGPPDVRSYLTRNPGVEEDLIEFFAGMHYMHEVARAPGNEFCGIRVGVDAGQGDD
ncbi:MAG: hypothetical protein ACI9MC_000324 [Kiritimatiellia bacterium]|jgi:hypothetical protein